MNGILDNKPNMRRVEPGIIGVVLLLAGFGVLMVFAASGSVGKSAGGDYFLKRQLIWAVSGFILAAVIAFFNYSRLKYYASAIYALNILFLFGIAIFGKSALGAQRWFSIGIFHFQPSEFAKMAVIISLAAFLAKYKDAELDGKKLFMSFAYISPILGLILIQPDLGTAMVILAITLGMLISAGIKLKHLFILLIIGLVLISVVFQFHILKDYQAKRLVVFINPNIDPRDSGYNLRQSMIAIGSGKLTGKGLFSGTQSRLNFLPERHTDFIFSVVGEEFGFIGSGLLIFGFFLLLSRTLSIGYKSRNYFGLLLATGIASMWFFQALINIGMTIGIAPITGIPLPFISYGGSAMVTNMLAFGILLSVYARRFK